MIASGVRSSAGAGARSVQLHEPVGADVQRGGLRDRKAGAQGRKNLIYLVRMFVVEHVCRGRRESVVCGKQMCATCRSESVSG